MGRMVVVSCGSEWVAVGMWLRVKLEGEQVTFAAKVVRNNTTF